MISLGVEGTLIQYVVELYINLVVDAVNVRRHRLVNLVQDAIGACDKDCIGLRTYLDPDHEDLVQTAFTIYCGLALICCALAYS